MRINKKEILPIVKWLIVEEISKLNIRDIIKEVIRDEIIKNRYTVTSDVEKQVKDIVEKYTKETTYEIFLQEYIEKKLWLEKIYQDVKEKYKL